MGLDVSHDCFSGPYSAFNRWRDVVATVGGYSYENDITRMWQYTTAEDSTLPKEVIEKDKFAVFIFHMDCDGDIPAAYCYEIADRLEGLLTAIDTYDTYHNVPGVRGARLAETAKRFIEGLRCAAELKEDVLFR